MNEEILASVVRVIGGDGEQIGVMRVDQAIDAAFARGLDLVEISPNAEPPVCRMMDFGKFKYEQSKKKGEAKKKQTVIQIKEIKLRLKTEDHDLLTKLKHVQRFVKDGDKVKISVVFRGREITHPDLGDALCQRVLQELADQVAVEQMPRLEGRALVMLVGPKVEKK